MMVDFGSRHERKELLSDFEKSTQEVIESADKLDAEQLKEQLKKHVVLYNKIVMQSGNHTTMDSVENSLFRKTREQAKRSNTRFENFKLAVKKRLTQS